MNIQILKYLCELSNENKYIICLPHLLHEYLLHEILVD